MNIQLPDKVRQIIETLQAHGYEAYAVGGCVRDSLLGRKPEDWDITTSALPEQTKALFARTFDTGIEHGTITVLLDKEGFEVTTYRIDGEYEDSRHPKEVVFTRSLSEDLLRRDFTINAMAYNEQDGIVDLFGGTEDLRNQVIRCVGNAKDRFGEDALRMMRAVRFSAQLGFAVEEETKAAICQLALNLKNISAERIQTELVKLLTAPHPEQFRLAYELGITRVILPEFDALMSTEQETPHHCCNVGEHTIRALCACEGDKITRMTMLFHDMGKPARKFFDENGRAHFKGHAAVSEQMTKEILHRLKFDNETFRKVTRLVFYHDYRMPATFRNVRRAMHTIGEELFPYYLQVRRADTLAQSDYQRQEKLANLKEIEEIYRQILEQNQCVSLKALAVRGGDLIQIGVPAGPRIGEILNQLLEIVLEDPTQNQKEVLLQNAKMLL